MKENLQLLSSSIITLMYHRIDAMDTDPWGICVSPEHFEQQVQFLKKNFNIIRSEDLIEQVRSGDIIQNSICLTFDDGYADNYTHAKPILEKYNCPATIFIATAFINQTKLFWWDELEIILLHSKKLPHYLYLKIHDSTYKYFLDKSELTKEQWLQHKSWKWYETPPTKRCKVFLNIREVLRPLSYKEIEKQLTALRNWACVNNDINMHRLPMNEHQLGTLSQNNLFTVAMHTHTHADLQTTEKHFQAEEILSCKKLLKNKYDVESNCLAYPYGRYNDDTIELIKELQIAGCFTTEAIAIDSNTDLYKLGRYQVGDWDIISFKNQLNTWFMNFEGSDVMIFDTRKP